MIEELSTITLTTIPRQRGNARHERRGDDHDDPCDRQGAVLVGKSHSYDL